MQVIGIVAEYNPFHSGHHFQIRESRRILGEDCPVVAVMSGNWVQQADCAIADKWTRARLALEGGADLVLELPTPFATASAETFARGAVELLHACGVVTHLSFGCESAQLSRLEELASFLDSEDYSTALRTLIGSGLPFALCRQRAAEQLLDRETAALLEGPNNNLGIEYLRTLNALSSPIRPITVPRRGAAHNSLTGGIRPDHVSATQIRAWLREGDPAPAEDYLMPGGYGLMRGRPLPSLSRVDRALLARLRTMTVEEWARLPDSGHAEGLTQRLEREGKQCSDPEDFLSRTKTKRFTHARLRRLLLWAYLGLEEAHRPPHPAYLRVLGFNSRGQELLRRMKTEAALPIITKPAHARRLPPEGLEQFERECRYTDLYDLCFEIPPAPGREWNTDPVMIL